MAANPKIIATRDREASTYTPGQAYPSVQVVALSDGLGNLIKATDNGDGTATLDITGTVDGGGGGATETAASTVALTGSNQLIAGTPVDYRGVTIRETSGTAGAQVWIYDNTSSAGTVIEAITLNAGESVREYYPEGISTTTGIYVQVVSGAVAGSVRTSPDGGTEAYAVPVTGSGVVSATPVAYRGFSLRESTGSAGAVVRIYDHASTASGPVIEQVSLSAGQSSREYYPDRGVAVAAGIYVEVVSGSVAGSVRAGA